MSFRGAGRRLAAGLRALGARLRPAGAILCYHRIAEPVDDPWSMSVDPRRFERHMAAVRHLARPSRVAALIADARAGRSTRGRVAVSFDDGYADNLAVALPVLERFDVPATLFACTGLIDAERPPWWDELAVLLGSDAVAGRSVAVPGAGAVEVPGDPGRRGPALARLHRALRALEPAARDAALGAAFSGVGAVRRTTATTMTSAELREFAAHPLTDLGGHSRTHPSLAGLPADRLRDEVAGCRERLRELTGVRISGFAYPFGQTGDVDRAARQAVADAGFDWACVVSSGSVRRGTDTFRVPRLWVRDLDGAQFERFLASWVA